MKKHKLLLIIISSFVLFGGITMLILSSTSNATDINAPIFYVANAGDGTISKVDFKQKQVIKSISLDTEQLSHGIAISPDEQTVYYGTGFQGKTLHAFDVKEEKIKKKISFDEGLHGIDIHPSGKYVYVSLMAGLGVKGGVLAVIDTENFEEVARIQTGDGPAHVSVTNDGSQVWVANVNGNSVSVVDSNTYDVLATVPVGEVPNEVAVSPTYDYAYSANVRSNTISVIDMKTYEVVREIEAGEGVHGVTVSPDGKEVWTANNDSNNVTVIETESFTVVKQIDTSSYANHIAFSPDGEFAFVTHRESNDLVVINREDLSIAAKIKLGKEPHEMTLKGMVLNSKVDMDNTETSMLKESIEGEAFMEGVEVKAKLLSPDNKKDLSLIQEAIDIDSYDYYFYAINMTTHSGDLTEIPFEERITLESNEGISLNVAEWIVVNKDSHHPQYLALFNKSAEIVDSEAELSLVITPFINNESLTINLN